MFLRFIFIACCFCFWGCDSAKTDPTPTELTIQFVNQLRPQLVGTWQLRHAQISSKKQVSVYHSTGITKDTLLKEVATLMLVAWSDEVVDERILHLGGTLRFRAKDYPIHIKLWPNQNNPKTKGFLFIDYHYQQGLNLNTADADYLSAIGLIGENFNLETELGDSTMTWKGLNRAIVAANFTKNK
jgi:hypothetical protein